jgi:hypothetical protein
MCDAREVLEARFGAGERLQLTETGISDAFIRIIAGREHHDIQLGSAEPETVPAPPVACTCTMSTCEP